MCVYIYLMSWLYYFKEVRRIARCIVKNNGTGLCTIIFSIAKEWVSALGTCGEKNKTKCTGYSITQERRDESNLRGDWKKGEKIIYIYIERERGMKNTTTSSLYYCMFVSASQRVRSACVR